MNYTEAMKYIQEVGNFGSSYGLDRTKRLLELVGDPHKKIKVIHIGGTNGKGSTTAMISAVLKENGYKVGMYTSPFIEEFEERIQINGENIDKNILAKLVTEIKEAVEVVIKEGYNHPTEFEIITTTMFLYFYREKVDFAVVEVGLGGRLDSTNVVDPILTVITSISYDHTNLLGDTLMEIAREKSGIIKENIPLILFRQEKEALDIILERAKEQNAEVYYMESGNKISLLGINKEEYYQEVCIETEKSNYNIKLPLLGEHQCYNLFLAIKAIEVLNDLKYTNISVMDFQNSITKVKWMGRLEVMGSRPLIVIDGAHNIQGIITLSSNIEKYFDYKNLHLILGILADKDVENMVEAIVPKAKNIYAVTPNSYRAELAEDLKKVIIKYNEYCIAYDNYNDAFESALRNADKDDLIMISGSLYMIGDMRKIICNKRRNKNG